MIKENRQKAEGQRGTRYRYKEMILWKPSMKLVAGLAIAAFAVMMVPLLRLALYSVPWYDDYLFGRVAKVAMEEAGNYWGAVKGAVESVRTEWYAWQGTYTSIFFMTLTPLIWGEDKYFLGPVFLLLFLALSVFVLVKVLVKDVLKADRASCLVLQAAAAATVIMFIYTAKEGFYWYNAGFHYVGMHSLLLVFTAGVISLLRARKKGSIVVLLLLSMLGALMVAGGNFVTTLQGLLVLLSIAALGTWFYKRRALLLLPSIAIYAVGFYKNVTAPGNDKRAANFVGWGYSPAESILRSFWEAFRYLGEFTGWITLAVLVLLVPVIWQMIKKCDFHFHYPGLVLLWSFCLYATGFTPSLYSLGHAGLSRTLNAVKITYQLLLLLNEVYWLGWLNGYLRKKGKETPAGPAFWWFYPVMGAVMLLIFHTAPNQAGCYSAYGAYYYIHTGEAYNFHQQYLERVEVLKSDVQDVLFEPYRFKPWFLCVDDLSEDPDNEANWAMAVWYGKNSVAVKKSQGS